MNNSKFISKSNYYNQYANKEYTSYNKFWSTQYKFFKKDLTKKGFHSDNNIYKVLYIGK